MTAKLFNRATGKQIAGSIATSIRPGLVLVIVPTSMIAGPGTYQCDVQIQFDPAPGYKTVSWVFKVENPEFS